ncbi:DUF732 domain-containing protein [Arthrobacter sp. TMN-50]
MLDRRVSKRAASATLLCLMVGLVGCSASDDGTAGAGEPREASRQRFLSELRDAAPDSAYSKDEQLIATGERVCAELAAGADLDELGARDPAENLTDETVERIRITQALASEHLCPDAA